MDLLRMSTPCRRASSRPHYRAERELRVDLRRTGNRGPRGHNPPAQTRLSHRSTNSGIVGERRHLVHRLYPSGDLRLRAAAEDLEYLSTAWKIQAIAILSWSIGMISVQTHSIEAARHERAISTIAEAGDASLEEIRGLFAEEFARLDKGAKIRKYLHALAVANVRAKVREAARIRR